MTSMIVMAWDPTSNKYKVHHYDKDASDIEINTTSSDLSQIGTSNQYEPNFFGSFTTSVTLDARPDFTKIGNPASGGFGAAKNPHAYVIFTF